MASWGGNTRRADPAPSWSTGAIFVVALAVLSVSLVAAEPVRVGLHDAPPMAFRDDEGRARGFVVEVLEHIASREGWELEYVHGSWSECERRLRLGEIDLLFPILRTLDRETLYDFTHETMYSTWGRVFSREHVAIESILDLDGMRIAGVREDSFSKELSDLIRRFGLESTIVELETTAEVLEALETGAADAAALEDKAGYWYSMQTDIRATPVVFQPAAPLIAAPRGRQRDRLAVLDHRLRELKADPSSVYYRSYEAWFGRDARPWPRWLPPTLIGGGGLLVLFAVFVWILRSQVRMRTRELSARNEQLENEVRDRRRAEDESRRLEEQLLHAQKMEAMGTLAAGVAHDFNNLLMVIRAQTTVLANHAGPQDDAREALGVLDEAIQQATRFTRSLLAFSRKLPTDRTPVDLCNAVRTATRMLRRALPASIELVCDLDCEPCPWVSAEEHQLQQIVLNLAVNARDAMPDGGTLRITVDRHDGMARIRVADTGAGMTESVRIRIFEPFFTTKSRGRGTGLGLAFVHGIVEKWGGLVDVQSAPGDGSTFVIALPLVAEPEKPSTGTAESPSPGRGELILIAEDRQPIRETLAAFLDRLGYEVCQAGDGDRLLGSFVEHASRVRLLVLDVDLPRQSGLDALREIRARGYDTPAIVMSGSLDDDVSGRFEDVVVLNKPFELARLGELAGRMLAEGPG